MHVKAHFAGVMLSDTTAAASWIAFAGDGNSAGEVLIEECRQLVCSQIDLAEYQAFGYCLNSILTKVEEGKLQRLDVFGSSRRVICEVNGTWTSKPDTERYRDRCRELMLKIAIKCAGRWDYPRIALVTPEENALATDLLKVPA